MMKSADNTLFQTKTTTKHKRVNMDKNTRVFALVFCQHHACHPMDNTVK